MESLTARLELWNNKVENGLISHNDVKNWDEIMYLDQQEMNALKQ